MKNFTFAKKWHDILKDYSTDIRNEIYVACIEYFFTGSIIEMQPVCRMAFDFIRHDMDERERMNATRREKRLAVKETGETTPEMSDSEPEKKVNISVPAAEAAPGPDNTGEKSAAISALLGGLATHALEKVKTDNTTKSTSDRSQAPKQHIAVGHNSKTIKISVKKRNNAHNENRAYSSR